MQNSTVRYMAERLRARAGTSHQAAENLQGDAYYQGRASAFADGRASAFAEAADYLVQVLTDIEAREAVEHDRAALDAEGVVHTEVTSDRTITFPSGLAITVQEPPNLSPTDTWHEHQGKDYE